MADARPSTPQNRRFHDGRRTLGAPDRVADPVDLASRRLRAKTSLPAAVLQQAQADAVRAVRPGIAAAQRDQIARTRLAEAGLAGRFIHGTGHGIGLEVHEAPYIVAGDDTVLREGMAFSVEPGIYFSGAWGARIEDIVLVTADGGESLNNRPRELHIIHRT